MNLVLKRLTFAVSLALVSSVALAGCAASQAQTRLPRAALDRAWTVEVGPEQSANERGTFFPTSDNGLLVIDSGTIQLLDLATGEARWSFGIADIFPNHVEGSWIDAVDAPESGVILISDSMRYGDLTAYAESGLDAPAKVVAVRTEDGVVVAETETPGQVEVGVVGKTAVIAGLSDSSCYGDISGVDPATLDLTAPSWYFCLGVPLSAVIEPLNATEFKLSTGSDDSTAYYSAKDGEILPWSDPAVDFAYWGDTRYSVTYGEPTEISVVGKREADSWSASVGWFEFVDGELFTNSDCVTGDDGLRTCDDLDRIDLKTGDRKWAQSGDGKWEPLAVYDGGVLVVNGLATSPTDQFTWISLDTGEEMERPSPAVTGMLPPFDLDCTENIDDYCGYPVAFSDDRFYVVVGSDLVAISIEDGKQIESMSLESGEELVRFGQHLLLWSPESRTLTGLASE